MTLEQVEQMDTAVLTPSQVASVLHLSEQTIRLTARNSPKQLGFPVIVAGNRVVISRIGFINFMKGETQ